MYRAALKASKEWKAIKSFSNSSKISSTASLGKNLFYKLDALKQFKYLKSYLLMYFPTSIKFEQFSV